MYSGKEGAFVLKMVRWHRQKKNNGNRKKRIASAVCMLGVLVVCLGVVGYRNKLKADEKLPVMTRGGNFRMVFPHPSVVGATDTFPKGKAFLHIYYNESRLL